jgi:hypothetical protein
LQNMATRTSERRRAASADAFARLFPSAANTESMRRSAARGACFFSRALTCPRPAVFSVAGVGQRVIRSGRPRRGGQGAGPRARSRAGWIWVSSPRNRLDVAVYLPTRASSKPQARRVRPASRHPGQWSAECAASYGRPRRWSPRPPPRSWPFPGAGPILRIAR